MTDKSQHFKWLSPSEHETNKKFFQNRIYGKANKPRYQEPSMYEILSWNDSRQENRNQKIYLRQGNYHETQQHRIAQKIVHCKSLDQFVRSMNIFPMTMATESTKYIKPPQQIQTNFQQQTKENDKQSPGILNQTQIPKPKMRKFQKKAIPFFNSQKKPRYMQEKKTAIQKLIESDDFDEQKFEKIKKDQIKKFKQTTRDLPNSAFLTFFNKPPFENYGRQNNHTTGVLYGDYMYSHNIFPHTGDNNPNKQQTYDTALNRAKSAGNIRPHPPMTRHLEEKLITGYLTLSEVYPKDNSTSSIPINNRTVLENLPMFNHSSAINERKPKYNTQVNANDNNKDSDLNNHYLKNEQVPTHISNQNQIEGKQIRYTKKLQPRRNIS